jgi:Dolichyl-phosphate-mannose-protein mannosyltransferase
VTTPWTTSGAVRSLALPALLLFLGGFGVWAIALDQYPDYSDTMLFDAFGLWESFTGSWSDLLSKLTAPSYLPPLCYLPASLLFLITGPGMTALRLTVLLQFLASVWLAHDLGRRMAGRAAGLLCAVLLGTFPLIFGWGRMGFMDMGLALMVLLALRLLLSCNFDSFRSGAQLGLVVGLGMLSKVAFPIFAVGPLLWAIVTQVRNRRHLAVLGLTMAAAVAVCGWWYLLQWRSILVNSQMSSVGGPGVFAALVTLTVNVDGGVWLLTLALVGSLLAWRWRTVSPRQLALLALTLWPSLALMLLFHPQPRYMVPVYAVAAVLAGVCVSSVLERFGARLAHLCTTGLALVLLGYFTWSNIGPTVTEPPLELMARPGFRVSDLGLIFPDRRRFEQYPSVLRAVERRFSTCLVVFSGPQPHERHLSHDWRLRFERPRRVRWVRRPAELERSTAPACVLLATNRSRDVAWRRVEESERGYFESCLTYGWFEGTKAKRLMGEWGPSRVGVRYLLYEVDPRALNVQVPRPDYCRWVHNVADSVIKPRREGPPAAPAP